MLFNSEQFGGSQICGACSFDLCGAYCNSCFLNNYLFSSFLLISIPVYSKQQMASGDENSAMDEVASIISSLSGQGGQRLNRGSLLGSHNKTSYTPFEEAVLSEGSDALRDVLSSISASSAPQNLSRYPTNSVPPHSIAGSSFLEKFASVTEKTRDLELGKPSLHTIGSSRRGSAIANEILGSPQQSFREPRKQSFSEKLDNYISATGSPTQSRHLSFNSGIERPIFDDGKNIWNPGSASTFHPTTVPDPIPNPTGPQPFGDLSFMQGMPPQMMMPPPQFMQNGFAPQMFVPYMNPEDVKEQEGENEESPEESKEAGDAEKSPKGENQQPAISPPFIMAPFNPYAPPPFPMPISPIGTPPPQMMMPTQMMQGSKKSKQKSTSPPNSSKKGPQNQPTGKKGKFSKFKNGNSKQHIVRSPLLEEFRANKNSPEYTLDSIVSHAYEFAKDQDGSRFIQHQLKISSEESKELFFKEIINDSMDLMTDVFGNYVIQKYFEYGTQVQKKVLFENMRGNFNELSVQMYGCRVVQKCIEGIELEDQLAIIEELRPNIFNLVKDQNGNHVIQKTVELVPIERIPFVLDSLKHQIYHLSMHPYGCRVIQRLLEFSPESDQKFILNELKGFIFYLVQDQFGNYVIQHVIESSNGQYQDEILKVILDNLIELSKHKFASNAVEKCIIHLPSASRVKIYNTMLENPKNEVPDETTLMKMMKDPFANYVVQRMVELIDHERKRILVNQIKEYLDVIRKSHQGKHLASIEKLSLICSRYD